MKSPVKTPEDSKLWNIVKRRCVPLGQPVPGDPVTSRLEQAPRPRLLDLHHCTLEEAYSATREFIEHARDEGWREIEIVTGRSGQIRREFETWAVQNPKVRGIEPLHGGGAFRVKI
jgi:DNA-nicking Smr family endonuclease